MSHVKRYSIRSLEESCNKKIFVIPQTKSYRNKMYKLQVIDVMNKVDLLNDLDYMNKIYDDMIDNLNNIINTEYKKYSYSEFKSFKNNNFQFN